MATVASADGTQIGFTQQGSGPRLVIVDGAFCSRGFGPSPKLAPLLADRFTVITYDRRGRGESTATQPYAIDRELEDLAALTPEVVFGLSSGAMLAARAAAVGLATKLVMYEPPVFAAGSPGTLPPDRIDEAEAAARRGDRSTAVKAFMRSVGVPAFALPIMRILPGVWTNLTAAAHTLPHDLAMIAHSRPGKPMPAELSTMLASIAVPTIVGVGGKSPAYMKHGCAAVASAIAGADVRELAGQTHNASATALATLIA